MRKVILAALAGACAVPASAVEILNFRLEGYGTFYTYTGFPTDPVAFHQRSAPFVITGQCHRYPGEPNLCGPLMWSFRATGFSFYIRDPGVGVDYRFTANGSGSVIAPDDNPFDGGAMAVAGTGFWADLGMNNLYRSELVFSTIQMSITQAAANLPTARVSLTIGVPEPATWGMMIGGFALAGGALRQRRTRHIASFCSTE